MLVLGFDCVLGLALEKLHVASCWGTELSEVEQSRQAKVSQQKTRSASDLRKSF